MPIVRLTIFELHENGPVLRSPQQGQRQLREGTQSSACKRDITALVAFDGSEKNTLQVGVGAWGVGGNGGKKKTQRLLYCKEMAQVYAGHMKTVCHKM
jgi:secreted trypsin-like serine protease